MIISFHCFFRIMAETSQNPSQSELNNEHIVLSHKKYVSYDVAVMCDKYNAIL